jgi:hypothetical protein
MLNVYPSWTNRVSKNQLLEYWTVSCEEKERPMDPRSLQTLSLPDQVQNSVVKVLMVNGWKHDVVWNKMGTKMKSPRSHFKNICKSERKGPILTLVCDTLNGMNL